MVLALLPSIFLLIPMVRKAPQARNSMDSNSQVISLELYFLVQYNHLLLVVLSFLDSSLLNLICIIRVHLDRRVLRNQAFKVGSD